MPSSHLILWGHLLLLPSTFPRIRDFSSHLFTSDDQSTRVSVAISVLAVTIQGWSLLRLTGLISLLSKGLSGVFSTPQFKGITALSWQRGLCYSTKLWGMPFRATQDGLVIAESSDKMWSTGGGNGKPPWHTCIKGQNILVSLISFLLFNVAIGKFKVILVSCILFLLDRAALDSIVQWYPGSDHDVSLIKAFPKQKMRWGQIWDEVKLKENR